MKLNILAEFNFNYLDSASFILNISDKDECEMKNGGCVHECTNTDGGYECYCHEGFVLLSDHHNCQGKSRSICYHCDCQGKSRSICYQITVTVSKLVTLYMLPL